MDTNKIITSFGQYFSNLIQSLMSIAPTILKGTIVFIAALFFAFVLQYFAVKLISSFDSLFKKITGSSAIRQAKLTKLYAFVIGKLVFISTLIFFIFISAEILKWPLISKTIASTFSYLPNIFSVLLILLGGTLLGSFIKRSISQTLDPNEQLSATPLATAAQYFLMLIFVIMAIGELGLNTSLLNHITVALLIIIGGGAVLAISSGSKILTANIIGAQYAKKYCKVGKTIKIDQLEGEVVDVTQTAIVVESENGICFIPARLFHEKAVFVKTFYSE